MYPGNFDTLREDFFFYSELCRRLKYYPWKDRN